MRPRNASREPRVTVKTGEVRACGESTSYAASRGPLECSAHIRHMIAQGRRRSPGKQGVVVVEFQPPSLGHRTDDCGVSAFATAWVAFQPPSLGHRTDDSRASICASRLFMVSTAIVGASY